MDEKKEKQDMVEDGLYYRYSDLLDVIYRLGRARYDDKTLVHCILASFTSEMVREYYSYRYDSDGRKDSAKLLKKFLGHSFGGEWIGNEVAKGKWKGDSKPSNIGYVEKGKIAGLINYVYKDIKIENVWEQREELLDEIVKVVPCMECLSLLFFDYRDNDGNEMDFEWEIEFEDAQGNISIVILSKIETANFDIFGFIGKELKDEETEKFKKNIQESLTDAVVSGVKKFFREKQLDISEDWEKVIRTKIIDSSIWHGAGEDYKIFFPFYNLDMAYNVMKRVRRKVGKDQIVNGEEDLLKYFKTVYGYIAHELKREDDFYNEKSENESTKSKMYEDFRQSPFIKAVGLECKDEPKVKAETALEEGLFQKILCESLRGVKVEDFLLEQEM